MMTELNERKSFNIENVNGFFKLPQSNKNANAHWKGHQEIRLVVDQIQKEDNLKSQVRIEDFYRKSFVFFYLFPDFEFVFESKYL
jgi:hypothetical protein